MSRKLSALSNNFRQIRDDDDAIRDLLGEATDGREHFKSMLYLNIS